MSFQKKASFCLLGCMVCVLFGLPIGYMKASGVFFIYLQNSFDASALEISSVLTLATCVSFLGGMVLCFCKLWIL